ncbi:MAG: helix-turn-helix transcriptional regulator [Lentisphaeria bacterium]|nr:helix-turn-helix transcriptional regulator [Lentisphaeria bacterium]
MRSLIDICSALPYTSNPGGTGISSVPPLIPEQLKLYCHHGKSYELWNRSFNHGFFIMVFMLSGRRTVNIDDCSYTLEQGEVIIIPPYARHSFGDEYRDFESLMASFVIHGDSRRLHCICGRSWKLTRREEKTIRTALGCFSRWLDGISAAAEEAVCHFAVLLRQIQSIAVPELNERKLSDAELPLLTRITAYLAANRNRHVTLAELSRELHVSGSSIRQTFRKKMNVSIGHYQLVQRLRHGIRLLQSTNMRVAEIAEKVGFSTANGFMLAIRRECNGATPKRFRKEGKK